MDGKDLENLKYNELQKLAKANGIRANMKIEKLIKALKDHYERTDNDTSHGSNTTDQNSSTEHDSEKENSPKAKREKKKGGKRGRKKKVIDKSADDKNSDKKMSELEDEKVSETKTTKIVKNLQKTKSSPAVRSPITKKQSPVKLNLKSRKSTPTCVKPTISKSLPVVPQKRKRTLSKEKNIPTEPEQNNGPINKKVRKSGTPTTNTPTKSSSAKSTPQNDSTPSLEQDKRKSTSPGIKSMIKAMDGLSKEDMKATLLDALAKKVQENPPSPVSPTKSSSSQSSSIPRYTAVISQKSTNSKVKTPDWKKIHRKEFSKWDNIETYMEKRKKRAEGLTGSFQSVQKLLKETQTAVDRLKNTKTPQITKPVRPNSARSSFQSPRVFKPTTISTKNLNLTFDTKKTPQTMTNKKSPRSSSNTKKLTPKSSRKTTTPAMLINSAKSIKKPTPQSSINKAKSVSRQSTTRTPKVPNSTARSTIQPKPSSTIKSSNSPFTSTSDISRKTTSQKPVNKVSNDRFSKGGTPCKFKSLNSSILNSSMKKPSFDLKASLSKPMTWKPHKGKLKPLDLNTTYKNFDKSSYKTPQTQTIKDRRRDVQANRAEKKFQSQMNKRGLSLC